MADNLPEEGPFNRLRNYILSRTHGPQTPNTTEITTLTNDTTLNDAPSTQLQQAQQEAQTVPITDAQSDEEMTETIRNNLKGTNKARKIELGTLADTKLAQ
jgi:hypothetical protein